MGIKIEQGTKVWLTSDLHFGHNKDFVVSARGFSTVEAMNEAIADSGEFEIYLETDEPGTPSFIYQDGIIKENM